MPGLGSSSLKDSLHKYYPSLSFLFSIYWVWCTKENSPQIIFHLSGPQNFLSLYSLPHLTNSLTCAPFNTTLLLQASRKELVLSIKSPFFPLLYSWPHFQTSRAYYQPWPFSLVPPKPPKSHKNSYVQLACARNYAKVLLFVLSFDLYHTLWFRFNLHFTEEENGDENMT